MITVCNKAIAMRKRKFRKRAKYGGLFWWRVRHPGTVYYVSDERKQMMEKVNEAHPLHTGNKSRIPVRGKD